MFAMAFAAVPLYRMFCQKTGYGGTPKLVASNTSHVVDQRVTVHFSAQTHRDLPWAFIPLQAQMSVRLGETSLAFYQVTNKTNLRMKGIATYNVTPDPAGQHFHKIHCFCFEDQWMEPGESMTLPVQFFVSPDLLGDRECRGLTDLTLSYTFFQRLK